MKIDQTTLKKLAHLARLEFDPSSEKEMITSMEEILTWVEKLDEVDTEGVEPLTNMSYEMNRFRADQVGEHLSRQRGLSNAPDSNEEHFKVPKVIE